MRLAKALERYWGRRAVAHLCVSKAMQAELATAWHIPATVFYDRAPKAFHPTSDADKHELLLRLSDVLNSPMHSHDCCSSLKKAAVDVGMDGGHLREVLSASTVF